MHMRISKQLAIRDLLGVTTIIAIWLAIYSRSPFAGYFAGIIYFLPACTFCAAWLLRQPLLVFFLPLAFSSNLLLLLNLAKMYSGFNRLNTPLKDTILSNWVSLMDLEISDSWPTVPIGIGIVVTFVIAVSGFIVRRTHLKFGTRTSPKGVVLAAIRNGALSGVFVAMQFGLPVLISCLATWFTSSPVPIGNLVLAAAFYPCVACTTLGAIIGGILGFVSVFATSWRRWLAIALLAITAAVLTFTFYICSLEAI